MLCAAGRRQIHPTGGAVLVHPRLLFTMVQWPPHAVEAEGAGQDVVDPHHSK